MATKRTTRRASPRPRDNVANLHKWATGFYAWLQNDLYPWILKVSKAVTERPDKEIQPPPTPPKYPPAKR